MRVLIDDGVKPSPIRQQFDQIVVFNDRQDLHSDKAESIPRFRDPSLRNALMSQIDQAIADCPRAEVSTSKFSLNTIADCIRYELFFALEEICYTFQICEERTRSLTDSLTWRSRQKESWMDDIDIKNVSFEIESPPPKKETIVKASTRRAKLRIWNAKKWVDRFGITKQLLVTQPDFLFFECFPNSTKAIDALLPSLKNKTSSICPVFSREQTPKEEWRPLSSLVSRMQKLRIIAKITSKQESLAQELEDKIRKALTVTLFFQSGSSNYLRTLLRTKISETIWFLDCLSHLLEKARPAICVCSSYASIPGRALAHAAKQRKVPFVYLQHGLLNYDDFEKHVDPDLALVWGEWDRMQLSKWGVEQEKIFVVGSSKFGKPETAPKQDSTAESKPKITYFPSRHGGAFVSESVSYSFLQMVIEASRDYDLKNQAPP